MRRLAFVLAVGLVTVACGAGETGNDGDGAAPTTTVVAASTTTTKASEPGGEGTVAQEGDFVAVHYIGTLDDGTEFDASRPRGATLDFEIGSGSMIAGFDAGVRGMSVGETRTIRIEPADAYGEIDPSLIVEVDLSQVPEGTEAGDTLVDPTNSSQVRVVSVEGDVVTLDLNARLAGEALTFEIEMVAINP
ncbi:MAG: FKBP-type peptidyl-prolyl cis-trans isomerase [Acidimicrobiia bacterium]|nr:FKBP-type peptidyl-prolyl cis-trans isomerase [Acidimicrobiia bacterium]